MTKDDYNNLSSILEGDKEKNAVESFIQMLHSPIAKRKEIIISVEDSTRWN